MKEINGDLVRYVRGEDGQLYTTRGMRVERIINEEPDSRRQRNYALMGKTRSRAETYPFLMMD